MRLSIARLAALLLPAWTLGLGCTEKGRSLVLVDVTTDVTPIDSVRAVVVKGTAAIGETRATWNGQPSPLSLGVFVPKDVSGSVDVIACGFAGGAAVAASATAVSTTVAPGQTIGPIAIRLTAATPSSLCAALDGGTGGTTGGAGAGGTTGGAGAGGTTGTGGTVGAAGASGTTGAGGTTGITGRGGTTGAAGAGGTTGAGGRGGTTGTGGSTGGTGPGWHGHFGAAADPTFPERFPHVAVDASGNAVVVYERNGEIWSNRYNAATDMWGPAMGIETRAGSGAQEAAIAVDRNGVWLAVWNNDPNGTLKGVYASTSSNGTTWSTQTAAPTTITNSNGWGPVLSMNADGAAVVAWTESISNGSLWQAGANTRPATGSTWTGATAMRAGDDNGERTPAVAMSSTGEAFVLWTQSEGNPAVDEISVWIRRRMGTMMWGMADRFETYDSAASYGISVAANRSGAVIVTYQQVTANRYALQLLSSRYTPGAPFSVPLMIMQAYDMETILAPSVTLDDSGMATAAWASLITATGKYQVYTGRAGPTDTAWTVTMMENNNDAIDDDPGNLTQRAPMPVVRSDPSGNVTLIWRKRSGMRFDLYANRFAGTGWSATPTPLESRDTTSVVWPWLDVGSNGTAVAVWFYPTPELDVWANVYR